MHRLRTETVDLLIVDSDSEIDGICRVVRQIRDGLLGYDPFLAIMALTSNAIPAMIKRVLDIGCDDLIARPISPKVIAERTANLIHHRKKFVATANYVGPDRFGLDGGDDELPKIEVPNALRHKATGIASSAADLAKFSSARDTIVEHRIGGLAAQICSEALKFKSLYSDGAGARIEKDQSGALLILIAAASELIAEHNLVDLRQLGESMTRIAQAIATDAPVNERVLAVLHLHGEAIAATLTKRDDAKALMATVLDNPISSEAI